MFMASARSNPVGRATATLVGSASARPWAYADGGSDVEKVTAPTDLLVVIPDAGADDPGGSSYTDWWNGGKGGPRQWETFHLVELRQLLERNWHAGDKRAIAGVSAGGYGAIEYAARQPGSVVGAAAMVVGAALWTWCMADRASNASAWLIIVAAALYGIGMLQSSGWGIAGYVLLAYAAAGGVALLLGGPPFFVVAGFYLAALAPALVLWQGRA
jgi:S-formylglutathione hydrolase FrmB